MQHRSLISYLSKKAAINDNDEAQIRRYFRPQFFKKKTSLINNGLCNKLYFVNKGLLRAVYCTENGKEFTRTITWENRFLTNILSFKDSEHNGETFECIEDAEILSINKQDLDCVLSNSILLRTLYCDLLEEYSASNLKRFQVLNSSDITSRMRYLKTDYPHLIGRVNDSILASFLCISRETFVRHKSELYK